MPCLPPLIGGDAGVGAKVLGLHQANLDYKILIYNHGHRKEFLE